MVHRKSTYRITYKKFNPAYRKTVWEENSSFRRRKRQEEFSHHGLEEEESSECECDEDSDDQFENGDTDGKTSVSTAVQKSGSQLSLTASDKSALPANVPRLEFTPEETPRSLGKQVSMNEEKDSTEVIKDTKYNGETKEAVKHTKKVEILSGRSQGRGVMKKNKIYGEYDLLPVAKKEDQNLASGSRSRPRSAQSAKFQKYPLTPNLTRTTRRNYLESEGKRPFVSYGQGGHVRTLGDKSSYNVYLNEDAVHDSALDASRRRNTEIDNLIHSQRKMTLEDWRSKHGQAEKVNHSSIWADSNDNIYQTRRQKPRSRVPSAPSRVEAFSGYCRHCGGRRF
ncbi:uncharacterized protein LOC143041810 [Oratosquilla oratoria]|uniref:uncharacterized protein LOC143041810 n=1 Tax=Oratosquilla oratoria TaxID=337810 RepID=UPI003F75CDB0